VTLVDTNILLDLTGQDGGWADWSQRMLEAAALRGPLLINDVIFAELSIGFDRIEDCLAFVEALGLESRPIPPGALFLAGKVFRDHRRRGGPRSGVLPDFFIGAHAAHDDLPLLTRDPRRYATSFPSLRLIAP
jgi:predicted nucleic acid-binding protein